jgi:hypothetical protein
MEDNFELFNKESVWDNNKNLFDLYLKDIFIKQRHIISNKRIKIDDNKSFDDFVEFYKK